MISGVSSSLDYNSIISSNSSQQSSSLSYNQQQIIDDTLSEFDSSNLTQSDALEIVSAFQDAGIEPSKQLEDALSSLGFDAQEIGDLAGITGGVQGGQGAGGMPPPPPPPPSSSEEDDEEEFDTVSSLLETLFSEDEDDEDSSSYNTVSDYTSRILNLNDDAKEDIMSTFEKYSDENSALTTEEKSTLVKSYLSEILNNSSNYNHSSFYA